MAVPADVEIDVRNGEIAIPKEVRINGFAIPNVSDFTVRWSPNDARRVTIELLATSVKEVPVE